MIIATMNCRIGSNGVFYFSLLIFFFFFTRSPVYINVCACVLYKPNTNFMTAISDRFHPITIVGRPRALISIFAGSEQIYFSNGNYIIGTPSRWCTTGIYSNLEVPIRFCFRSVSRARSGIPAPRQHNYAIRRVSCAKRVFIIRIIQSRVYYTV